MAKRRKKSSIGKILVTALSMIAIVIILNLAPNYIRNDITNKTNLVINNGNVTKRLKNDVLVKDDVVYISQDDVENFFDGDIYYDSKYDQIVTTSDTKVAALPIGKKQIEINSSKVNLYAETIEENGEYYIPFSEISKSVYNVETKYVKNTDTVVIVSLDRKLVYANSSKDNKVKYQPTFFSKTVDKIKRGDNVTVVTTEDTKNRWTKITTEDGKIGYVKTNSLVNAQSVREDLKLDKQIEGKVSLAWDYFSEYASAPTRTGKIEGVNVVSPAFISLKQQGKGKISTNIGNAGVQYINWAHNNGYKVWALASNNSWKDTTSEIINDYRLREKFINNIIDVVVKYNLDGINLDFENIYEADKDAYSKLVLELAPRLREIGKVLSVDVTAPDGSADWSLCYNRNLIAKTADYIVFMAYDQNGISSTEPGTTAGYDWVETNLNKFLKQEEVDSEKIILGIPFYTRIWKTNEEGKSTSEVVFMKDTYKKIPSDASIEWDDTLKQNYAEYKQNGATYRVWIEDIKSIREKLLLINKYNLSGASFWAKDRETSETWDSVSEILNIK